MKERNKNDKKINKMKRKKLERVKYSNFLWLHLINLYYKFNEKSTDTPWP